MKNELMHINEKYPLAYFLWYYCIDNMKVDI